MAGYRELLAQVKLEIEEISSIEAHELHGERYSVRPEAWTRIEAAERVLAVGTTTVRVLETVASNRLLQGRTSLFVTPGFEFRLPIACSSSLSPCCPGFSEPARPLC